MIDRSKSDLVLQVSEPLPEATDLIHLIAEHPFLDLEPGPLVGDDLAELIQMKRVMPGVGSIADLMEDFRAFQQIGGFLFMVSETSLKLDQTGMKASRQIGPPPNLVR